MEQPGNIDLDRLAALEIGACTNCREYGIAAPEVSLRETAQAHRGGASRWYLNIEKRP
jgi:hypothetical protein